jgi:hypothetical protein
MVVVHQYCGVQSHLAAFGASPAAAAVNHSWLRRCVHSQLFSISLLIIEIDGAVHWCFEFIWVTPQCTNFLADKLYRINHSRIQVILKPLHRFLAPSITTLAYARRGTKIQLPSIP